MEQVLYTDLTVATAVSNTASAYIGYHDQILLRIPALTSCFGSSPVVFTVQAAHNSATTVFTHYFYDYVNQAPAACRITAAAAGVYELPFAGGVPYVKVSFDTAATNTTTLQLIYPRANF